MQDAWLLILSLIGPLLFFLILISGIPARFKAVPAVVMAGSALPLLCSIALVNAQDFTLEIPWLHTGDFDIQLILSKDALSALMALMVTAVNLMVQVFSLAYMKGDKRFSQYFAYLFLFTFSMLGIVYSGHLVFTFMCWELVGLSSWLLIGFWYAKPASGPAARKAFLINRVGDAAFISGILLFWRETGELSLAHLSSIDGNASPMLALSGFLMLLGAMGKSAQLPFQAWLPDAMAGPTPASAMIHAATMVAAGVYFAARIFPIFSTEVLLFIALTGALTAALSASSAMAQTDIKKILAYSTLSQLGLMMLGIGVSAPEHAVFHLFTHAFFKCGLFLSAAVILDYRHHQYPEASDAWLQDIRNMQGLRKVLPFLSVCFAVLAMALSGIPLFSGFMSKEGILLASVAAAGAHPVLGFSMVLAFLVVLMTPLYMMRLWKQVFMGTAETEKSAGSLWFYIPLGVLALASTGFFFQPLLPWVSEGGYVFESIHGVVSGGQQSLHVYWVPLLSLTLTTIGLYLGYRIPVHYMPAIVKHHWGLDWIWSKGIASILMHSARGLTWFEHAVMDGIVRLTAGIVVAYDRRFAVLSLSGIAAFTDTEILDRFIRWLVSGFRALGWIVRMLQTGNVQGYLRLTFAVLLIIFIIFIRNQ